MSAAENAKKIVGKPYTTTREAELKALVPGQAIDKLSSNYVRTIKPKTTYVVVDKDETVITVLVGA